jgi:hypothetical protein
MPSCSTILAVVTMPMRGCTELLSISSVTPSGMIASPMRRCPRSIFVTRTETSCVLLQHLVGVVDALVADLRHVQQAVDALGELDEGAEGLHPGHLALVHAAHGVALVHVGPGVGLGADGARAPPGACPRARGETAAPSCRRACHPLVAALLGALGRGLGALGGSLGALGRRRLDGLGGGGLGVFLLGPRACTTSMRSTMASISSPTFATSCGRAPRSCESSDSWMRPSTPPRSTKMTVLAHGHHDALHLVADLEGLHRPRRRARAPRPRAARGATARPRGRRRSPA